MSETYTLCPTDNEGECTIEGHKHPAWSSFQCEHCGKFFGVGDMDLHDECVRTAVWYEHQLMAWGGTW